jgi:tetratricopeptide (TPR) repeat protein
MAAIRLIYDKKPAEADREWKVAMELDPNHAYTWHTFGFLGSFVNPHSDEVLAAMQRAYRLEPLSAAIACDMAMPYHLRGQYDSAVTQCHAALDLHPAFTRTYVYLARSQAAMGMYDAAIETCLRARPMFTGRAYLGQLLAILGFAYGRAGETCEAMRLIRELEDRSTRHFVAACDLGLIYAGIGDADRAMEFLERAYDQQEVWVIAFPSEPLFRVLDGHARFHALARRVFPESVR